MMNKIFEIDDLKELEAYLEKQKNIDELREHLFTEFVKYADYKNATEWNKAVRLCESLAIVGWGTREPLEALRGMFFNGSPMTYLINKFGVPRFVEAIWSKRKAGLTMEQGRTTYYVSPDHGEQDQDHLWEYPTIEDIQDVKLDSQRNWTPKNPIWIERTISNCYENSKQVIEWTKKLQLRLNAEMQAEKYGRAVNRIILHCCYSYYDHYACKTNYIIADEKLNLKQKDFYPTLLTMYSKQEIEKNGYYLRNRFEYGPFRSDTGKVNITIHLEKEFSELTYAQQKHQLVEYLLTALNTIIGKLKKKKLNYDFDLMLHDFNTLVTEMIND